MHLLGEINLRFYEGSCLLWWTPTYQGYVKSGVRFDTPSYVPCSCVVMSFLSSHAESGPSDTLTDPGSLRWEIGAGGNLTSGPPNVSHR